MKRISILFVALMMCVITSRTQADTITYGFDDGTFQGWELYTVAPDGSGEVIPFPVEESPSTWIPSNATIDIGDGFSLLPATSGDYRVIPDPWADRDCIGLTCNTQILRSPSFQLNGSGDLTIDMIGGAARSNIPFDPIVDEAPTDPGYFFDFKDGIGFQGFAVLDVEANEYVAHGFSTGENDGKARASDPPGRGFWETVTISQDELSAFANDGKDYAIDIFDSYSGGWGWIGFDTVVIPAVNPNAGTPGDFDGNDLLDAADIDALSAAINTGDMTAIFDVDGSGMVDANDRSYWVDTLKNTYFGDANLDGEFNSSDFVLVFGAGEYEDAVAGNSGWADGDWNGDGDFNSSDFVAAFSAGGYELGPRPVVSAVPEPASMTMLLSILAGLMLVRRRK